MGKKVLMCLVVLVAFLFVLSARGYAADKAEYAGAETCKGCHEEYYGAFAKSAHGKKAVPDSPANREGCESCHGPGAEHSTKGGGKGVAIFGFGRGADPNARSAKCLACHEDYEASRLMGYRQTQDDGRVL